MDIIPPKKKNVILDATSLSSLMSCATYYDLRMNHNFTKIGGKSNSLETGSLAHKVLEVYYKHIIQGFSRNTAIGNALTAGMLYVQGCPGCMDPNAESTVCKHEPGEYPGMMNTPEHSVKFTTGWKFVLDTCEQYFEFYKNDAFLPISAEEVRGEILYEDDELRVLWKAKFDLIIDNHQIGILSMDHKSFKQKRDKTTLSNQFKGQSLLLKSRNVIVNKIGFQSTLPIRERLSREVVSYTADSLLEWQSEILPYYAYKYVQYKESGYWPPNYTSCQTMYGKCEFVPVCEADRNIRVEILRNEFQVTPKWDPVNSDKE